AVHGPPLDPAAGGRGPGGLASGLRPADRRRPVPLLRLRRQPLGPPAPAGGGESGGGESRRRLVQGGPEEAVAGGGLAPGQGHASGAAPGRQGVMLALELYRSIPKYVAARTLGERVPGLLAGPLAPLRLVNRDEPALPAEGWARVRPRLAGICGSDLATLSGQASFYFSSLVSMPFVPGHEVVGELFEPVDDLPAGTRVVLEPVLSCAARGLEPCAACASGSTSRCSRVTV